jgi:hypothetical protein
MGDHESWKALARERKHARLSTSVQLRLLYVSLVGNRTDDRFAAGLTAGQRFPEVRRAPRYFLIWPVKIFDPIHRTGFAAHTSIVSLKGCCIGAPVPLDQNTIVRLQIQRREEVVEVWARVTGTAADGAMGLAFLGTKHEETVARWISAEGRTP